jgi:hypothetical protein
MHSTEIVGYRRFPIRNGFRHSFPSLRRHLFQLHPADTTSMLKRYQHLRLPRIAGRAIIAGFVLKRDPICLHNNFGEAKKAKARVPAHAAHSGLCADCGQCSSGNIANGQPRHREHESRVRPYFPLMKSSCWSLHVLCRIIVYR